MKTSSQWTEVSDRAAVERMAAEAGRPVVWAEDGVLSYARPLAAGETPDQAFAAFDATYARTDHLSYEVID